MDYNMDTTNVSNMMTNVKKDRVQSGISLMNYDERADSSTILASPDHTNAMTRSRSHNRQNVGLLNHISKDVSEINAKNLRVLVPLMFQLWRHPEKNIYTDKVKGIWHEKNKPHDFPNCVEFRDPNNKTKMSVEELRKVFVYLREKLHMPDVSLHPQADIGPGQDPEEGGFHILTKCDDMIQAQEPVEDKPKVNTQSEDDGGTLLQYLETFCRSLQPDVDYNNLVQPDSICYDNAHNLQQLGIQEAQFDQPNAIPITKDDPGEKSIENCLREAVPEDDVQTKSQNNTEQPIMTLHDGLKVCTNQKQRDFQVEPAVIPVSPMCADLNSLNLTQEQQKVDVEEDLNIEIPSKFQHAVDDPFNTNQDIIDSQRHIPSYDKHVGSMTPATTPLEDKVINDILEMENDYSLKPYNKNITEKPAPSQTTPEQLMQVNANLIPLTVLHLEDLSDRDNCSPKPKRRCLRNKRKQGVRKC